MTQAEYLEGAGDYWDDQERYANEVASCAAERGFDANLTWDHGFGPPVGLSGAQAEEYWEVIEECSDDIYPDARRLSTEEVEEHYELLLAAAECLEGEGHSVPEPSSKEAFVSAYESGEPAWSPYPQASGESEELREARTACPFPGGF